jgi:hypothetical protein
MLRRFESTYQRRGQLSDNAMALMILLALASHCARSGWEFIFCLDRS